MGGTCDAAHLLGTPNLDLHRAYTGLSRSRTPTHTWTTEAVTDGDHGGRDANRRTAAEQVAAAMARRPDANFATPPAAQPPSSRWTIELDLER